MAKEEARLQEIRRREDGKKTIEMAEELLAIQVSCCFDSCRFG